VLMQTASSHSLSWIEDTTMMEFQISKQILGLRSLLYARWSWCTKSQSWTAGWV